jgi:hypothetical protein
VRFELKIKLTLLLLDDCLALLINSIEARNVAKNRVIRTRIKMPPILSIVNSVVDEAILSSKS